MLCRILAPFAEGSYALLRIVSGLMFAFHGFQKLTGILSPFQPPFGSQLWFGGAIEIVTGTLMAVGLFTSPAAFLASGTMAVAYVQFHWKLQGGSQLLPAVNQGELALLYSVLFLSIACRGGGFASIDRARAAKRPGGD
jgi:putative oxidoreductase